MWRRLAACGLLAAMLAGLAGTAGATVVLDVGTAGRAADWGDAVCGAVSAPVFQLGGAIGVAGSLITGAGRCRQGASMVVTEYFYLPADAKDIRLRISDFEAGGNGVIVLNGEDIADDDINRGFLPGRTNSIEITLTGVSSRDWLISGPSLASNAALAMLQATVSYDSAAAASFSNAAAAPVAEPPAGALLLPATMMLWALARRRRDRVPVPSRQVSATPSALRRVPPGRCRGAAR